MCSSLASEGEIMRHRFQAIFVVLPAVFSFANVARAQLVAPGDSAAREVAGHARDSVAVVLVDGDFAEIGVTHPAGISIEVLRPDGSRLRSFVSPDMQGTSSVQFVAEGAGRYAVIAANESAATVPYRLAFRRRISLDDRTRRVAVRDTILSPRMQALRRQLAARNGSTEIFWTAVSQEGSPLVEPFDQKYDLVTFVWRAVNDTRNVFLRASLGVPDEPNGRTYEFQQLDSTDVWFLTLKIPKGARFLYRLEPNRASSPDFPAVTAQADPYHASKRCPGDGSKYSCSSIGALPDTSAQPWIVRRAGLPAGKVEKKTIKSALQNVERTLTIYTPANYDSEKGGLALLVLFDGDDFLDTDDWHGLEIWDNLIAARKIPPTVVVMVHNLPGRRLFDLVANATFGEFMARELVPWIHSHYKVARSAARTVVGGASAGGLAAAYMGIAHPKVFGNVLSISGAFWWSPAHNGGICAGACATPNEQPSVSNRDATTELNWVAQLALDRRAPNVRFYLAAGSFEFDEDGTGGAILEETRHLRDILRAQNNEVFYEQFVSGHDGRSWPLALANGLQRLLGRDP